MKRFERFDRLDTALYKNIPLCFTLFFSKLCVLTLCTDVK